jgi:serine/threonine-protein phosphatase 2A regulatory subunit A
MNEVIGVDLLSQSLLPAIVDLSEDSKWRVRVAIIEHIPMLAEKLGNSFFSERLNSLCMTWLTDEVYSVRRAAAENLKKLIEIFGDEWSREHIVPRIERMRVDNNYLKRMTALYGIQVISSCLPVEFVENVCISIVLSMAKDPVPNVRFTVAKTLEKLFPVLKCTDSSSEIIGILSLLQNDIDRDVRYFSSHALIEVERVKMTLVVN